MQTSSTALETIGDNIANLNTTAFKSTRADQESLFALTLRDSTFSEVSLGGYVNPMQVGLGSAIGAIQRNFSQGTTVDTGVQTDLALDGQGFFILSNELDGTFYTRDGAFQLGAGQQLQSRDGLLVQGWEASDTGEVDTTAALGPLTIPLGQRTMVRATTEAAVDGNLDANDIIANQGGVQRSAPLLTSADPASAAAPSTLLTALVDEQGQTLFSEGDVVTVGNVQKGSTFILTEPLAFTVGTDGATVGDLLSFLEGAVAIHTDPTVPPAGTDAVSGDPIRPGISLDADGRIVVASNVGAVQAVTFDSSSIVNTTAGRAVVTFEAPLQAATGAGATTEFLVFDSLGQAVDLRLRFVEESRDAGGTTWRWYAESGAAGAVSKALQTGTLNFDPQGRVVGSSGGLVTIPLASRGAEDLNVTLDLSRITQLVGSSQVLLLEQDGAPPGVLQDFSIDEQGVITGGFSNGLTMTLGQVAVALFNNPGGLSLGSDGNYTPTLASGLAAITPAGAAGAGRILSAALEQSNVELAREFIGLMNNSTQFSASSRVITTADELLQELLRVVR
jgi:flagellar hook protein FlgE